MMGIVGNRIAGIVFAGLVGLMGTSNVHASVGNLEIPGQGSVQSGVGLVSGWKCTSNGLTARFDGGEQMPIAYGTTRNDTAGLCDDPAQTNTAFVMQWNYGNLSEGRHLLELLDGGVVWRTVDFSVSRLGTQFLRGASQCSRLENFPSEGGSQPIVWQESSQSFSLVDSCALTPDTSATEIARVAQSVAGALENPPNGSHASGIGIVSGWRCAGGQITARFNGGEPIAVAYGTPRRDTAGACEDPTRINNAYVLQWNYALLGDGEHTVRLYDDGVEFAASAFSVTTLGQAFVGGLSGSFRVTDFPAAGDSVVISWQQERQGFGLVEFSPAPTPTPLGGTPTPAGPVVTPSPTPAMATPTPMTPGTPDPTPVPTPDPTPVPTPDPTPVSTPAPTPDGECEVEYDSTYAIVQEIFDNNCVGCHGSNNQLAGLDLSPGNSYDAIFEVPSNQSDFDLVYPGDTERSYLYSKIAAPYENVVISGGVMPTGGQLTLLDVDKIRFWIYGGAPDDTVMIQGTDEIVEDACLADPEPFLIAPLKSPEPQIGIQIEMPFTVLDPAAESETCVAVFEDFCDLIPEQYRIPNTDFFYYDINEIRMPPMSHHMLVQMPAVNFSGGSVAPEQFSDWTCRTGERAGQTCDPRDQTFCGEGRCTTPMEFSTACIGYGPANGNNLATFVGTQQPQFYAENYQGVYSVAPCRTVVAWNLHAFNLTAEEAEITAQVNFEFADDRRWPSQRRTTDGGGGLGQFGISRLTAEGAAAYTENTLCTDVTLPRGCFLTGAGSHNHQLGARAWWTDPSGNIFYDSRIYNDPVVWKDDNPTQYSGNRASRTFRFCTLYRNGIDENGDIDTSRMSRSSKRPYSFFGGTGGCEPYRCVNESLGEERRTINCDDGSNNFRGNDAVCDSNPSAGDGFCDGCSIQGGITTQDEMYQGNLEYFCPDNN
jgi:hypothetical protein